ncbi:MAG: alpha/beta fold hydrolase [Ktedonobacteraceae bacterium]
MMQERQAQPPFVSTGFVEVNGSQLYYEVAGSGHPLVLSYDMNFFDRRIWDEQFAAFARSYRVVRYDIRGLGKSTPSTGPYSLAEDLAQVLHALLIESTYLLNLGGNIALDFVHEYPSCVDALLIVSPNISPYPSFDEAMAALPQTLERYAPMVEAIKQHDIQRTIDEAMRLFELSSSLLPEAYQHVRTLVTDNLPDFSNPPQSPIPDIQAFDTRYQWFTHIQAPTLLLIGANAPSEILTSAKTLEQYIPGVQRREIAHAQNLLNVEQPEAFNQAVLAFLQASGQS